jgi:phospholipid/cholesterol/gamma-HCH transport system substrate-binding protein
MSTTDNKQKVKVGIFVFLGIVIFVAGIFILGGQQKRFVRTFRVNAVFDNVAGLKVGNNVWFSGVKIGTVKAMTFYGESQVQITMNIEEDAKKYIRKNSKARIGAESLIGSKLIEIFGGTERAPEVENGDRLATATSLSTDDLMATLQENNKNLVDITSDMKLLSSKLARGEGIAGAVLTDTTLATNFRTILEGLQQASNNSVKVSRDLAKLSSKFNTEGGLANELLTDTIVFGKLRSSITQLQQTATSAAEMTSNFRDASNQLNNSNNTLGALMNDQQLASNLKRTMENLGTSSEKLEENMEALQHNFLLRGYFRRKAKREAKDRDANPREAEQVEVEQAPEQR